jgi:hypothetical protein
LDYHPSTKAGEVQVTTKHTRRSFLIYSAGSFLVPVFTSGKTATDIGNGKEPLRVLNQAATRNPIAPLFCLAYITPDAPGQDGQEPVVARYPVAVVPQDERNTFREWRDKVRIINPDIVFLAYQMVHEETSNPGPGHDELRKATNSWCSYPNGFQPFTAWGNQRHRLYDPRTAEFAECFLRACRAVLRSYPYDGLFLDNCTIFPIAHPMPSIRAEMREALQAVLLKLRRQFPEALIVGNSSYKWKGLNGEMNENRPADLQTELQHFDGHASPSMDMYQTVLSSAGDVETVRRDMSKILKLGAFYGASVDYEHVLWFDDFDKVIDMHRTKHL